MSSGRIVAVIEIVVVIGGARGGADRRQVIHHQNRIFLIFVPMLRRRICPAFRFLKLDRNGVSDMSWTTVYLLPFIKNKILKKYLSLFIFVVISDTLSGGFDGLHRTSNT